MVAVVRDTADTMVHGEIAARAPFDFQQSLAFIRNFTPTAGEQLLTERSMTKAIDVHGQIVAFALEEAGTTAAPTLAYTLRSLAPIDDATHDDARRAISNYLSLDDDLRPFYALAAADPHLAPVVRQLHGFHQVRFLSLAECACWSVLSQHIAMPVAKRMRQAIAARYGGQMEAGGQSLTAFPSFTSLAGVSSEELADVIGNRRRAAALRIVLDALAEVDEDWLRTAPYGDAEAWLRTIPGIGPWSAAAILLRGLGRPERLILEMRPLLAAFERRYGHGADLADIAGGYGAYVGWWALYLRAAA